MKRDTLFLCWRAFAFGFPLYLLAVTGVVGLAVLQKVTEQAQTSGPVPASSIQTHWAPLGSCSHKVFAAGKAERWRLGVTRGVNLLAGQLLSGFQMWATGQVTFLVKLQASSRWQVQPGVSRGREGFPSCARWFEYADGCSE